MARLRLWWFVAIVAVRNWALQAPATQTGRKPYLLRESRGWGEGHDLRWLWLSILNSRATLNKELVPVSPMPKCEHEDPSSGANVAASISSRLSRASLLTRALGVIGAIGIGSIGLTAGEAQAITVSIGGQQWDVTTFTGSYNNNIGKFQTVANGGVMPWWGQVADAADWADALGWALGDPNTGLWDSPGNLRVGPAFGWSISNHPINSDEMIYTQYVYAQPASAYPGYQISPAHMGDLRSRSTITWAQATQRVPGPLPLFGAVAALRASRLLKKRIEVSEGQTTN